MKEDAILKRFVFYGVLFEIMNNFHKPFAVKFLERIGGNELAMSLFNALPGLITVLAVIPGAIYIRKQSSLKHVTLGLIASSRFILILIAAVPFATGQYRVGIFLVLYALMCFPDAVYQTAYQAYIASLFKIKDRAFAISLRNKLTVPLVTVMTIIIGQVITKLPQTEDQRIVIYQCFYVLAFVTGVFEFFVFKGFTVQGNQANLSTGFKTELKQVMKNRSFWFFTSCSLLFHFGWQMGWPLFNIYTIKYLGADEMWLAILSVSSSITMYFAYGYWSKQISKKGNAFVLAVNTLGMAITPILYVYSSNLYWLTLTSMVSGIFVAGTTTVLLSGLLEATPEKERVTYLAVYSTLTNLSLAISPLVGHVFLSYKGIFFALYVTAGFRTLGSLAFFYRSRYLQQHKKSEPV